MKMEYYREAANFGDALNPWLWPQILPGFFDDDDKTVFLGIGSIIGQKNFPRSVKKIVFGAAFVPEYHQLPDVKGPDWDIYFVRGPRTARLLGLSADLAAGDPAILLRTIIEEPHRPEMVSFIPHWGSAVRGNWAEACRRAGMNFIDPRDPVAHILSELLRSKLVIAESMHGAIVADALRIPWVPVLPLNAAHRGKWWDWAEPLEIKLRPRRLWPSNLQEARLSFLRGPLAAAPFSGALNDALADVAARCLMALSRSPPQLSSDHALDRAVGRMLENVERLKRDYASPAGKAA